MTDLVIAGPGDFAPVEALAFGAIGTTATAVDQSHPLPVGQTMVAATSTPLAGTASASATVGPFAPQLGRPIALTLSGSWTGKAQLMRSIDGGTTLLPLTVGGGAWASYTANCNEPAWTETEAAATFYLALTVASGTIAYRVSQ